MRNFCSIPNKEILSLIPPERRYFSISIFGDRLKSSSFLKSLCKNFPYNSLLKTVSLNWSFSMSKVYLFPFLSYIFALDGFLLLDFYWKSKKGSKLLFWFKPDYGGGGIG